MQSHLPTNQINYITNILALRENIRIDVTTKDTVVLMLYVFSKPLIGPANTTVLPDQSEAWKKHITLAQQYHLSLRQF